MRSASASRWLTVHLGGRLRRRRSAAAVMVLAAGLLAASLVNPGGASRAEAAATPTDYRLLELQVAQTLNAARTNPSGMADVLARSKMDGPYKATMGNGYRVNTQADYLKVAAAEASTQTPLMALKWSPLLEKVARLQLPTSLRGPDLGWGHGDFSGRQRQVGLPGAVSPIEAIAWSDVDPQATVYNWWISSGEYQTNAPWDPAKSYLSGAYQRGHRGIVNDARVTAVGVACGPWYNPGEKFREYATCVMDTGTNAPDESPVAPAASAKADLSKLPGDLAGSLGTTTAPGVSAVMIDTTAPTPTPTATASGVVPLSGNITPNSAAPTAPAPASSPAAPTSSSAAPTSPSSAASASATGDCPDADRTDLTPTAAAAALRCLIDQTRAANGLAPRMTDPKADAYASYIASKDVRVGLNNDDRVEMLPVCSGQLPVTRQDAVNYDLVKASTPRAAFAHLARIRWNIVYGAPSGTVGVAEEDNKYAAYFVQCEFSPTSG